MTFKRTVICVAVAAIVALTGNRVADAASDTAQALASIIAALTISQISDLDFGEASQGDAAKTVAPGSAENPENASFLVNGDPGRAYDITLPSSATMTTDDGSGPTKQVAVNSFQSTPATSGLLDASGQQTLFVGASRASILTNQQPGAYAGTFTVTVIYQ